MRWAAIGLTACVLTAIVLAGAISGLVAAVFGSSDPDASEASAAALDDIPANYFALYRKAAGLCPGLDWSVLAAIGKIESDHGRSTLPGVRNGENYAGAGGPMQFLKPTFKDVVARHQLPPGGAHPPSRYNPHDATHAAAWLLCDNGAGNGRNLRAAIYSYNHADWYVRDVLDQANKYRAATPAPGQPGRLDTTWHPEQATEPDPTSDGQITPRTHTLVRALRATGNDGNGIGCYAPRPQNPDSDHPRGKGCDVFFNAHDPRDVAEGWRVANWLITHQARYGINYLIWQGKYWSATQPRWSTYTSSAYGCPNPANLTGCHYDHIHISIY